MASSKDYDIVLYGATGFTGSLTAEYLAEVGEIIPSGGSPPAYNEGK
jgi:short subunit dehydrogenase-like uncharacterized protein